MKPILFDVLFVMLIYFLRKTHAQSQEIPMQLIWKDDIFEEVSLASNIQEYRVA